jgi:hypothetical protein
MKFLKYYKGDCYMHETVRDSVAGNDTCGPTTLLFKNDDETKSKVKYYNKYLKTGTVESIYNEIFKLILDFSCLFFR